MIEERQMMRSCEQTREEEHTGIDPHRGRLLLKVLLHMFDEGGHERTGGELIRLQQFRDPLQNSQKVMGNPAQVGCGWRDEGWRGQRRKRTPQGYMGFD